MSKKHVSLFQLDYMIHCSENENDNEKIDHINMTYIDLDVETNIHNTAFFIWKSLQVLQKALIKTMARAIYTYQFFFLI